MIHPRGGNSPGSVPRGGRAWYWRLATAVALSAMLAVGPLAVSVRAAKDAPPPDDAPPVKAAPKQPAPDAPAPEEPAPEKPPAEKAEPDKAGPGAPPDKPEADTPESGPPSDDQLAAELMLPAPSEEPPPPLPRKPDGGAKPVVSKEELPEMEPPVIEVAGFQLRGDRPWHRLDIDDLDVLVTPAGERFLPLLRLLKAFRTHVDQQGKELVFQVEGGPKTLLNVAARRIRFNGREDAIELYEAISDITRQRDVYLPAETVAEIFVIQLEWSDELYAFTAKIDRVLERWVLRLPSDEDIQSFEETLPERFPMAYPAADGLQFMELEMGTQARLLQDRESPRDLAVGNFRQQLWGNLAGGQYKFRFTEPTRVLEREGWRDVTADPFMIEWGEWVYRQENSEIAFGDSIFGLSGLVFPNIRLTGIRANGIAGAPPESRRPDEPSPGLSSYFVQPYDFEGYAKAGSRVQLLINDRLFEEETIVADSPTRPGKGAYRFEDIRLSPGVLNDVRIVIIDPDGVETQIRKTIVPTSVLLPKGTMTWLAAAGFDRRRDRWLHGGYLGAARATYGLTDTLTIGTAVAAQDGFYDLTQELGTGLAGRNYPNRGSHFGASAAYQPVEPLILSGEVAVGNNDNGGDAMDDWATNLRADFYPVTDLHVGVRYFRYSPGYFNGQNLELFDREGWAAAASYRLNPQWRFAAAAGHVTDNVDGQLDDTLAVDFQHGEVSTTVMPWTKLSLAFDRIMPSTTHKPQMLYTVRGRCDLPQHWVVYGEVLTGDILVPEADPDYFSGLSLPGLSYYRGPAASATIIKNIGHAQSVGGRYFKTGNRQRAAFVHSYRSPGIRSLQVRTEVGMDVFRRNTAETEGKHNAFIENRIEYLWDLTGRNRVGLLTRVERDEAAVMVYANLWGRFAFPGGQPTRILNTRVHPDRGGVHGHVFIDYNANGQRDKGEPGLDEVKVILRRRSAATTDANGYFVMPGLRAQRETRVALDIDTIPIIYYPTHGTQMVNVEPRSLTRVDFGVAPANTVVGHIHIHEPGKEPRPFVGARVMLLDRVTEALAADSITAGDGSYYLGNVLTGAYVIRIDPICLSKRQTAPDPATEVDIPAHKEPQDLTLPPTIVRQAAKETEKDKRDKGEPKPDRKDDTLPAGKEPGPKNLPREHQEELILPPMEKPPAGKPAPDEPPADKPPADRPPPKEPPPEKPAPEGPPAPDPSDRRVHLVATPL